MAEVIRLDPSPSKVFSWLQYNPEAEADEHHPACGVLTVRYRYNGLETEFWPVSLEEAQKVFNPDSTFGFSIGSAFAQIISPYKSKRKINSGERQETKKQREQQETRAGRRWLA